MSAKEFYQGNARPAPILQHVPPEIWTIIIQYAGAMDIEEKRDAPNPMDSIADVDREYRKALRRALVTRRYLVRVSKAWHEMAAPFLYEHILLGRAKCVAPLCESFMKSQQQHKDKDSTGSGRTASWWTRRLDISIRDRHDEHLEEILSALGGIFSSLVNLETLTISGYEQNSDVSLPADVLDRLSCVESLKAVHWHAYTLLPPPDAWTRFLKRHTHIESLKSSVALIENVELDSLKTAYYRSNSSDLPSKLTTLNLKHLMLDSGLLPAPSLQTILSDNGPRLSLVEIRCANYKVGQAGPFSTIMPEIENYCDNLTRLQLRFSDWDVLQSNSFLILRRQIDFLGLTVESFQISNGAARLLMFYSLPNIAKNNPRLKVIQFLKESNLRALHKHENTLKSGVLYLSGQIVLKDPIGNILSV